jgi:hypothetical protein
MKKEHTISARFAETGSGFAEETGFETEPVDNGVVITLYRWKGRDIAIPATIDGKPVIGIGGNFRGIGDGAFRHNRSLTSVTIPPGVTWIGKDVFYGCENLISVTIPDSVTSIGKGAFSDCSSLRTIAIPAGVTRIEAFTFSGCFSLTSVTIPESVTSIGSAAFSCCYKLSSITIPARVHWISENVFSGCPLVRIPEGVRIEPLSRSYCSP